MHALRRTGSPEYATSLSTVGTIVRRPFLSWLLPLFARSRRPETCVNGQRGHVLPGRYAGWAWRDETERAMMNDLGESKMFKVE
jgi:hypothetical protein